MRVLAITLNKMGGYSETIRRSVLGALAHENIDFDTLPITEDLSQRPGYDIYLGVGDELFWRRPDLVQTVRRMGGLSIDMRSRYMARKLKNTVRWFTDHRQNGPDWVFTHLKSRHRRAHYIGQCVNADLLYPDHDADRLTVFIDHFMPKRRSALESILDQCRVIHRQNRDVRFWYMSHTGIVENDFALSQESYKTYPFDEIAAFYRKTHIMLPTHRETQGMLGAEIGMCGGLTLIQPWMYPAERRAEIPHLLYKGQFQLPGQIDIIANREKTETHFSMASFAGRIKTGLERALDSTGR